MEYINNSVGNYLKCKFATPKILPFVDTIYVSINAPDSITIHVKEKKRAVAFSITESMSILIKMDMHWKVMKKNMTMFRL